MFIQIECPCGYEKELAFLLYPPMKKHLNIADNLLCPVCQEQIIRYDGVWNEEVI